MLITFSLEGKKNYQVRFSQMGDEVGGGVLIELLSAKGKAVASTKEPTGCAGARILAGWLMEEMPR